MIWTLSSTGNRQEGSYTSQAIHHSGREKTAAGVGEDSPKARISIHAVTSMFFKILW